MLHSSLTDGRLSLFCLVDGETTSNALSVEVTATNTVDDLKGAIKVKLTSKFEDIVRIVESRFLCKGARRRTRKARAPSAIDFFCIFCSTRTLISGSKQILSVRMIVIGGAIIPRLVYKPLGVYCYTTIQAMFGEVQTKLHSLLVPKRRGLVIALSGWSPGCKWLAFCQASSSRQQCWSGIKKYSWMTRTRYSPNTAETSSRLCQYRWVIFRQP